MAIFNSYVSLPEGSSTNPKCSNLVWDDLRNRRSPKDLKDLQGGWLAM